MGIKSLPSSSGSIILRPALTFISGAIMVGLVCGATYGFWCPVGVSGRWATLSILFLVAPASAYLFARSRWLTPASGRTADTPWVMGLIWAFALIAFLHVSGSGLHYLLPISRILSGGYSLLIATVFLGYPIARQTAVQALTRSRMVKPPLQPAYKVPDEVG